MIQSIKRFNGNRIFVSGIIALIAIPALIYLLCILKQTWFDFRANRANNYELEKIGEVSSNNEAIFKAFKDDIEAKTPWTVYITSGHRDYDEQVKLHLENPKNAKPGYSKHNNASAVDINVYQHRGFRTKMFMKVTSKKTWQKTGIIEIAKKHNLVWGGSFKNYHDPVHFEIPNSTKLKK